MYRSKPAKIRMIFYTMKRSGSGNANIFKIIRPARLRGQENLALERVRYCI
jgi:hypothetical protein